MRDFKMNDHEAEAAKKWTSEHVCMIAWWRFWARRPIGNGYPHFTYSFTPTGIGESVTISCHCGAKRDVTDYSSW